METHLRLSTCQWIGGTRPEGIKLIIAGIGAKEKQERFSQKTVNDIYTRANNPNVAAFCAADFIFCGAQDTQCVRDKTGQTVGNVVWLFEAGTATTTPTLTDMFVLRQTRP
ncbi:hypothetical protein NM208_g6370 [Fusarium decemcellulare]|uniref:Uncharacterized protein n=1 Tax=Fusarium decemcellulare TaxID=57161 RepID=A0ACC1SDF2_9HYPO|nr:hypothetical protein NM208_g6370 [Fusarium decemcellulare]